MLQKTYTKAQVDQFYKDVEAAGIKKLGAKLAGLTGLSSGNVSEYLRRKKEASDKLINAFYEHYGSSIKTPSGNGLQENGELMPVLVKLMETQNKILQDQKSELVDRVRRVESNLDYVAGKAEALEYDVLSGRSVTLRSLARIEGLKDADQLLNEADKIRLIQAAAKGESYKKNEAGKMSKRRQ